MPHRVIEGLQWARRASEAPFGKPRARKNARGAGIRYERLLAKALPQAIHGRWYEFADANGRGFCQPDLLLDTSSGLVVLEVKLTWVEEAHSQIEQLYRPVLRLAEGASVAGIVVCKTLSPGMRFIPVVATLAEALPLALAGRLVVLHWLGTSTLEPRPPAAIGSHLAPRNVPA